MSTQEDNNPAYQDVEYSDDDSYGPNRDTVISTGARGSKQYRNTRGAAPIGGSIVSESQMQKIQEESGFDQVDNDIIDQITK